MLFISPQKLFSFSKRSKTAKNVAKRLDKKGPSKFNFNGVTAWLTNNFNTQIAQYLEK